MFKFAKQYFFLFLVLTLQFSKFRRQKNNKIIELNYISQLYRKQGNVFLCDSVQSYINFY